MSGHPDDWHLHYRLGARRTWRHVEQAPDHRVELVVAERFHAAGQARHERGGAHVSVGWGVLAGLCDAASDSRAKCGDGDHCAALA